MFKVTVTEIISQPALAGDAQSQIAPAIEVYSQTLAELNLSEFIRVLNPRTRKRRTPKAPKGETAS